jgi:hypothetical protein
MKIIFELLYEFSYFFGGKILPKIFKKLGLSDDTSKTASGHSNLWTGILLGAGGAFIVMGVVAAILAGGLSVAPGVIGPLLLHGALGLAATAIGTGLFDAGEQMLGEPLSRKTKQIFKALKSRLKRSPKNAAAPSNPQLSPQRASSFKMTKGLAGTFRNALGRKKSQPNQPYKPAFDGPKL